MPAGSRANVTGMGSWCVSAGRQPRGSERQPSRRRLRLATIRIPRSSEPRGSLAARAEKHQGADDMRLRRGLLGWRPRKWRLTPAERDAAEQLRLERETARLQ